MPQHALNPAFVRAVLPGERPRRYRDGNRPLPARQARPPRRRQILGAAPHSPRPRARVRPRQLRGCLPQGSPPGRSGKPQDRPLRRQSALRRPPHGTRAYVCRRARDGDRDPPAGLEGGSRLADRWRASLGRHAFPHIGRKRVDTITSADVLAVLAPIWTTTPGIARQVRQRIDAVMKWAVAEGHRDDNSRRRRQYWRTARRNDPLHPIGGRCLTRKPPSRSPLCATPPGRPPSVSASSSRCSAPSRPGEARLARWDDIDLDSATWTIPDSGMKANRTHRVPLSDHAVAVLREAGAGQTGWVFPSPVTGGSFADNWLRQPLRRSALPPRLTVSARRSGTGLRRTRTRRAPSWKPHWRTPTLTPRRLLTHVRTSSSAEESSCSSGPTIWPPAPRRTSGLCREPPYRRRSCARSSPRSALRRYGDGNGLYLLVKPGPRGRRQVLGAATGDQRHATRPRSRQRRARHARRGRAKPHTTTGA